jgi:hypothetical protein
VVLLVVPLDEGVRPSSTALLVALEYPAAAKRWTPLELPSCLLAMELEFGLSLLGRCSSDSDPAVFVAGFLADAESEELEGSAPWLPELFDRLFIPFYAVECDLNRTSW